MFVDKISLRFGIVTFHPLHIAPQPVWPEINLDCHKANAKLSPDREPNCISHDPTAWKGKMHHMSKRMSVHVTTNNSPLSGLDIKIQ